jgi:16S rRNA (guanine966-N2)-methyltransferase
VQQSVSTWLGSAAPGIGLAFLDPPYSIPDAQVVGDLAALVPLLTDEAVVLLERSSRSGDPALPPGLELVRTRSKGDTAVHLLVPAAS